MAHRRRSSAPRRELRVWGSEVAARVRDLDDLVRLIQTGELRRTDVEWN